MLRKALCACLALGLLAPGPLPAQTPSDAEVAKGIKQVEDGDLDIGIFTLDAAARRLAADPARTRELAQAYLYLGIAYLGKGQETLAKTKFREAVQQIRELSLSPDQFPPRVIEFLDAAKQELAKAAPAPSAAPASPAPAAQPSPAPKSKGGSKLPLILLGGAAVAGGAALAAGGGGGGGARPTTPVSPADTRQLVTIGPELLTVAQLNRVFDVFASTSGAFEAKLTWTPAWVPPPSAGPSAALSFQITDGVTQLANSGSPSTPTTAELSAQVTARRYTIIVGHLLQPAYQSRSDATFTLQYKIP